MLFNFVIRGVPRLLAAHGSSNLGAFGDLTSTKIIYSALLWQKNEVSRVGVSRYTFFVILRITKQYNPGSQSQAEFCSAFG